MYAFRENGQRDPDADFDLNAGFRLRLENYYRDTIAYANGRFYVFDLSDSRVYAFREDGQRDPDAEFALHERNRSGSGIDYANGRFYVIDAKIWLGHEIYAYPDTRPFGEDDNELSYMAGNTIFDLPAGPWSPDAISGGQVVVSAGIAKIQLEDGGYFQVGAERYTCQSSGGCELARRDVISGTVLRTRVEPRFTGGSGPDELTFTVGLAIDELTLPEATGGDGSLTYTLEPEVPGLSFDAATRRIAGTPSAIGSHTMTYTATDEDGDTDILGFTVSLEAAADAVASFVQTIDLAGIHGSPTGGVAYTDGRYYVLTDSIDRNGYVYAYTDDWERDATADFELNRGNNFATDLLYVDGRFYVPDAQSNDFYVYRGNGQYDAPVSDAFRPRLTGELRGITYAHDRFYVVAGDRKVYEFLSDGRQVGASAYFDLHIDNTDPQGIVFVDGRFYVIDSFRDKVYAYRDTGQRDPSADFDLHEDSNFPNSLSYADGQFYVADNRKLYVFGIDGERGGDGPHDCLPPVGCDTRRRRLWVVRSIRHRRRRDCRIRNCLRGRPVLCSRRRRTQSVRLCD